MLSFGTDGVRGVANTELTPELALALGRASARVVGGSAVVIGRDPRRSGAMLEAALAAGFASEGVEVRLLGVVSTPVVAHAAARHKLPGAMISASHNPFPDNGIKLFAPGGWKLSDDVESRLEAEVTEMLAGARGERPTGSGVGTVTLDDGSAVRSYESTVCDAIDGRSLRGPRVLLDCAHGAASAIAPSVLGALGVDLTVVHAEPDGTNINAGVGSTAPAALADAVRDQGADVGLAVDGDADRLLAVDATGSLVDGDQILAVLARDRRARGALADDTVVVTVMSNLGFRRGMAAAGIEVLDTPVGDRNVLEKMLETGAVLGGEQSGHVIQTDLATTGDGVLTAVTLLDTIVRSGRSLHELTAEAMTVLPQVLVNVRLESRPPNLMHALAADISAAEQRLGDSGRVLVRPSGTEPLIRVMVEADTEDAARAEAELLADAVRDWARA